MGHMIVGFAALTATLAVLLGAWEAPRWAVRAFCVCAAFGALAYALSRPGPVGPEARESRPGRTGPGPVLEGAWDARTAPYRRPRAMEFADS